MSTGGIVRACLTLAVAAGGWPLRPAAQAADDPAWAVKGAPYRMVVRQKMPPENPETGTEIVVPDLGVAGGAKGGDYAMVDAAGIPVPVVAVWQGEGQDALLLASGMQAGQDYYLYVGGPRGATWTPKTSLLFETRSLSGGHTAFTSASAIQDSWKTAPTQGAKFVPEIFSANNPFGEATNFLSHFIGYLAPQGGGQELYTSSSDASFVLLDGQPFVEYPGNHPVTSSMKAVKTKRLPASTVPVRVDYYQAKTADGPPGMALGLIRDGKPETIPANSWLHPGTSTIERCEDVRGSPVPAMHIAYESYLGVGGGFLYEVQCRLLKTNAKDAPVEWRFDDGGVLKGVECKRLVATVPPVQRVTVRIGQGNEVVQATRRINFYDRPPKEAEEEAGHERYLTLLTSMDPTPLTATMLGAALPFLFEYGTDAQIAAYATPWLKTNPPVADPRWLPSETARLRTMALTDPKAALAALHADNAGRSIYGKPLDLFEIDLLVFYLRDAASIARVQQLGFGMGDTKEGRLASVRLGDAYRLTGDTRQATARYQQAQPPDPSNGRRLPAEDQANSMTVRDLIEKNERQEADAKLTDWELAHPMTKFTSDFLLLRSRVLTLYGRWREALSELDAYAATHPDSPYQIEVDFYRARALRELGKKDEARKIWQDIVKNYPRSELAAPSKDWASKS